MRQHVTRKVIRDCHSTGCTQVLLRELYQAASRSCRALSVTGVFTTCVNGTPLRVIGLQTLVRFGSHRNSTWNIHYIQWQFLRFSNHQSRK
jgi:hypothetical protein